MKKVLFIRTIPNQQDTKAYNVQPMGIGKAFCKLGYDYDYVAMKKNNPQTWTFYEDPNGCKARCIEKKRIRFFRMGINLEVCSKKFLNQYDLIITQEYYQIMSYWVAKNHDNVVLYSGPYWNMFMIPFSSFFYDLFLTKKINNAFKYKFVKSELAKQFLISKGYTNVEDIGVGLDIDRFKETPILDETNKLIKIMRDGPCLLFVGNLDENKNFPFLLEVFQKCLKKHNNLKLVLIGKSKQTYIKKLQGKKDRDYADEIFSKLDRNIRKKIIHIERIDNSQLQYVYPCAKAFLLPSKREIFGMVLLEAMYLGAPVVCSKNGGSLTLIKNKEFGQVIEEFDSDSWADAVRRYLEDENYALTVKENARRVINDQFTWDAIVKRIISIVGFENRSEGIL